MPTALLAPATGAANSADATVTASAPINFGLYTAAGGGISGEFSIPITRKNASGTYNTTGLNLTGAQPNATVTGPGVYRAEKPATTVAIGVQTD